MNIIIASSGRLISGSDLLSATLRTDLVPVPATLEFNVQKTEELKNALIKGADILVGEPSISLVIVKSLPLDSQSIKDGQRVGGIACTAVLKGCEKLIESANNAISIKQGTFGGILRACGAKVRIVDDLPVPEFICLKGQLPTVEIAKRLQQEAAVIRLNADGSLSIIKVDALLKSPPIAKYDPSAVTWVSNEIVQAMKTPSFISIASDGSTVEGDNPSDNRPLGYKPKLDTRQLKNLEKVLIHRGTMMRPLDPKLLAGNTIEIGGKIFVLLTAAYRVDTGALGGARVMASKVWLSSL